MKSALFGLLLFVLQFVSAQSKLDSLKSQLNNNITSTQIELLNRIGFEYWIVNPSLSIFYGQKAKQLSLSLNDSSELAYSFRVIGVAYWAKGSYDQALLNLLQGLDIYKLNRDSLGMANCMMNIGLVYHAQRSYDRSLDQYQSALDIFLTLQEKGRIATTFTKLGTTYIERGEFEKADNYLIKALNSHTSDGFEYGKAEALNRLGVLELRRNDLQKAETYLEKAKEISEAIQDREGLAKYYEDVASVYVKQGRMDEAELSLQKGANIALALGLNSRLRSIYFELKKIYASNGQIKKSLEYSDKYINLRDSLFNEEITRNLIDFERQLATNEQERLLDLKESQIQVLEQDARISMLIRVIIVIVGLLGGLIFYLIYREQRFILMQKKAIAEERARDLDQQLELKNRELAAYTVNYVQKNKIFDDLKLIVTQIKTNQKTDPELKEKFKQIGQAINSQLQSERDWEDFKLRFQTLHADFFDKLMEQNSSLTNHELRLSALIKLNMSMKEIANILAISPESVKTARYRLKKKLKLPTELSLNDFFNSIESKDKKNYAPSDA